MKLRIFAIAAIYLIYSVFVARVVSLLAVFKRDKGFENVISHLTDTSLSAFYFDVKAITSSKDMLLIFFILSLGLFGGVLIVNLSSHFLERGRPPKAGNNQYGSADLIDEEDFDKLTNVCNYGIDNKLKINEKKDKGGVILGVKKFDFFSKLLLKLKGHIIDIKLWIDSEDSNTLIIGASRSGKSRRTIVPSIFQFAKNDESIIISDPKGELYEKTAKPLKELYGYNIICLNFRTPHLSDYYNPLSLILKAIENGSLSQAQFQTTLLATIIVEQKMAGGGSDSFWKDTAISVVSSLIYLIASSLEKDFANLPNVLANMQNLASQNDPTQGNALKNYINALPIEHPARSLFNAASVATNNTLTGIFASALSALSIFSDLEVAEMTSRQDFDFADITKKKTAVFLIIPDDNPTRYQLVTIFVAQTYSFMVDYADNVCKGRLPRRINFMLDEFGNLPRIPALTNILTVCLGRGMRFHLAVQSIYQIKSKYDKDYETIKGGCHTWIFIAASDMETKNEVSKMTGTYTISTESSSRNYNQGNANQSFGQSESLAQRYILTPDEVGRLKRNTVLIMKQRENPSILPLPDMSAWLPEYSYLGNSELPQREVQPPEKYLKLLENTEGGEVQVDNFNTLREIDEDNNEEETAAEGTVNEDDDRESERDILDKF